MKSWGAFKGDIGDVFGVDRDYLHIPVGILLFAVFAFLLRRRRWGAAWAFVGVLAIQLANEGMDVAQGFRGFSRVDWLESAGDTLLTMALPALVFAIMRAWSRRGTRRADPVGRLATERAGVQGVTGPGAG